MEIKELRQNVDKVDDQIVELLEKRFKISEEVGKYKKGNGLEIENLNREKEIIDKRIKESGLSREFVESFFQLIFEESKKVQEK